MASDDWVCAWIHKKLLEEYNVSSIEQLSSNTLKINRKMNRSFEAATMNVDTITVALLKNAVGDHSQISFVVNVRATSIDGDALTYAADNKFAVGGYNDLTRALSLDDVSTYLPPTIAFIERGLRQHDRVERFQRVADLYYIVYRNNKLSNIRVVFLHEYELTVEHIRAARDRYGKFDMVANTDPNGSITESVADVAKILECKVCMWKTFLGLINR